MLANQISLGLRYLNSEAEGKQTHVGKAPGKARESGAQLLTPRLPLLRWLLALQSGFPFPLWPK